MQNSYRSPRLKLRRVRDIVQRATFGGCCVKRSQHDLQGITVDTVVARIHNHNQPSLSEMSLQIML